MATSELIDEASGINQTFTAGYASEKFGDRFHDEQQKYGTPEAEVTPFLTTKEAQGTGALWAPHGTFKYASTYDTNIEGTYNDARGDVVNAYTARWGLSRRHQRSFLSAFYGLTYSRYISFDKLNAYTQEQNTVFKYKWTRASVDIQNSFQPSSAYATGERGELDSDGRHRVTAISDNAQVDLDYVVSPKTTVGTHYNYKIFYLPAAANNDSAAVNAFSSQTHLLGPSISYKITPKTTVRADYRYEAVDFYLAPGPDEHSHLVYGTVTSRLTDKTGVTASAGVRFRGFKDDNTPSATNPTFGAGVFHKISDKVSTSVFYTQDTTTDYDGEAGQSNQQTSDFYGVNLSYAITPKLSVDTEASVQYMQKDGDITQVDIENPLQSYTRTDESEIYQWSVLLNWRPRKFVDFSLGYKFQNRNASFKQSESEGHKVLLSVNSHF